MKLFQQIQSLIKVPIALTVFCSLVACSGGETAFSRLNGFICETVEEQRHCNSQQYSNINQKVVFMPSASGVLEGWKKHSGSSDKVQYFRSSEILANVADENKLGFISYPNGDVFFGELANGSFHRKHGVGQYFLKNGKNILGVWSDGILVYEIEGNPFEGYADQLSTCKPAKQIFLHNCLLTTEIAYAINFTDGSTLRQASGNFFNVSVPMWKGKPNGKGSLGYVASNGHRMNGYFTWLNGALHGENRWQIKFKGQIESYSVEFSHDQAIKGFVQYANGSKYQGSVINSMLNIYRDGLGTLTKANEDVYFGYFKYNKAQGYHKVTFANGLVAYGFYNNNKAQGPHYLEDIDGEFKGWAYFLDGV